MTEDASLTLRERLVQVLDQLHLSQAHFCLRSSADVVELGATEPGRIASIILQGAEVPPRELQPLADRTFWVLGDQGAQANWLAQSLAGATGAHVRWLPGYTDLTWSDTVAERTAEVAAAMLDLLAQRDEATSTPSVTLSGEGEIAGVTYRATGSGTPVLLFPLGLSARQWEPLLPLLQAGHHCTIVLGGKYLDPVSRLEDRAAGDYSRMALETLGLSAPRADESLIEVGCGTGALLRRISRRTGMSRVTGLDVNAFLLREARALAAAEGLTQSLVFHEGSGEAIPLPDDTFDIAFSSTVLEEVDADRMLAEMVRITKPGGRVVLVVRAVDLPRWTNLPLPETLLAKVASPYGAVGENGCADKSLYRRFRDAGLTAIRGGPAWAWVQPDEAVWKSRDAQLRSRLTLDEAETWSKVLATAQAEGLPVSYAEPYHCALGVK